MNDTADLNLVLGRILPDDDLHVRATAHLESHENLLVPFSVGVELLFVAHRFDLGRVEALGAAEAHFEVASAEVLYTAAEALDAGEIETVFDAIHLADALHRSGRLHTADETLQASAFDTAAF